MKVTLERIHVAKILYLMASVAAELDFKGREPFPTLAQIRAGFAAYGPHGKALFDVVVEAMKTGLAQSLHYGFIAGMGMMIAALIVVFFLKEIPLRRKHGASEM